MRIGGLHTHGMCRAAAEAEDVLEQEAHARAVGEQHEKANHQVYALQGLPNAIEVQVDGQVHG